MNDNLSKVYEVNHIEDIKRNQKENNSLLKNLVTNYDEKQGEILMSKIQSNENPEFPIYYCLSESLTACENAIKAKPSRELALVKTKLQEALFWLNEA